jgi:riboflavin kinase/FMN adenylyltransferase
MLPLKIFQSIQDFKPAKKTIITIGTFDGVHVGHKKIIDRVIRTAADRSCESLILTFFPHPRMVLQGHDGIKLLNTLDEKTQLLAEIGLQNLIIHPFDEAFSRLTAREFVETVLVAQLNIQKIIIGHDHRFGRNRDAGIDDLVQFGEQYGFEVEQIPAEEIDEVSVSSTKIRNALSEGNMDLANSYLDYDYFLTGNVIKGRQLGRTIGFPTANIHISEPYKLIPKQGVFIVKSILEDNTVYGMMNIGTNPTVGGQTQSVEVYFLDFDKDLYGQTLKVSLLRFIRDEQKFESVGALKQQISKDKLTALSYIKQL